MENHHLSHWHCTGTSSCAAQALGTIKQTPDSRTSMIILRNVLDRFSGSTSGEALVYYNSETTGLVVSQEEISCMEPVVDSPSYLYLEEEVEDGYNFNMDLINWDAHMASTLSCNGSDNNNTNIGPRSATGIGIAREAAQQQMRTSGWVNGKVRSSSLGFEDISKYFYMTITDAAKELNVGFTLLKKRSRELGIPRWPHRKMKSLNSLIRNIQELGNGKKDGHIQREISTLEEHKQLMEKMPQLELSDKAKKLRQACFKANYKRKRAMISAM